MYKILIVEDDINLVTVVAGALEMNGFKVKYLTSGKKLHETISDFHPDVIMLDVMLGEEPDGFELARQIRENSCMPLIFATSRDDNEDIEKGFSLTETDYIRKPYKVSEVLARVNNVLKRVKTVPNDAPVHLGNFWFYPQERSLKYECDHIRLNNMENEVLQLLYRHLGQFVSRDEIVKHVWGNEDLKLKEGSLNNTLSRLRKYLDKDTRVAIVTRSTLGVKLVIES